MENKRTIFAFNRKNKKIIMTIVTFFVVVLFIASTYAWFSSSLNARVKFFNMVVSNDSDLLISYDAVNYTSTIDISKEKIIDELKTLYPNHTNQWALRGLLPVSSTGISSPKSDRFAMFGNKRVLMTLENIGILKLIDAYQIDEVKADAYNSYIAFDIFLKNNSKSPISDNLYFKEGTEIKFFDPENSSDADGTINSLRIGIVKIGTVPVNADAKLAQNLECQGECEMVIYEPNSHSHSAESIERAMDRGITIYNNKKANTFAIFKAGDNLKIVNGHVGSGVPLDHEHFAVQQTITSFEKPIFSLPYGVTKFRVYVWLEGQDIDSLETISEGTTVSISINFIKDTAGYDYYDE